MRVWILQNRKTGRIQGVYDFGITAEMALDQLTAEWRSRGSKGSRPAAQMEIDEHEVLTLEAVELEA